MNMVNRIAELMQQKRDLIFDKKGKQIDAMFVLNKFVELHNVRKKTRSMGLIIRRVQRLLLLTEVYYMQMHKEGLFKQNWQNYAEVNGLAINDIYDCNAYFSGEIDELMYLENRWQDISQKEYQKRVDPDLNKELDEIVLEIYNITEYLDSIDLIKLLKVEFPKGMSVPKNHTGKSEKYDIDKSIIYDKFKDFDFNRLRELNEQQKQNFSLEM